jgi:ankyrin repeat protein
MIMLEQLGEVSLENKDIFEIPLSEHAKKINEAFYLKPFQGKPQAKANLYSLPVERISHGAQHAARVAMYVRILINFFRAKGYPEALVLTEEEVFLLQIAALMHDVSRFDDRSADTMAEVSAQHCYFYFRRHGISEERSRYFSDLIAQKENGGFLGKILQASDSLDIMRCKKVFYVDLLEILSIVQGEHRGFLFTLIAEIGQLIAGQYDMKEDVVVNFQGQIIYRYQKTRDPSRPELKGSYEHSENCYLKTSEEMDSYAMLSMYFHDDNLLKLADDGSEMTPPDEVTRKRKLREYNPDVMLLTEELEKELLPEANCFDLIELNRVEEKTSEPAPKKAKREKTKSEAYICGYDNGINRIEKTRNPLKKISVPKKYVKKQDRKAYCLGYREGYEFVTKSLAEDVPIFYDMGLEAGERDAIKFYTPKDRFGYSMPDFKSHFKTIYGHYSKVILERSYKQGFALTNNYYICLLNNYYQNYIQAFQATIKGKETEKAIIFEHKQQESLTPEQLERINLQALAGHKEGIEFANLVIAENGQKDHFAFFRLQIKRLTKLYEEGTINWARQASFIAALHPKAWENRGYILRNHFCPPMDSMTIYVRPHFGKQERIFSYAYSCKEEATQHFVWFLLLLPFYQIELRQTGDEANPIFNIDLSEYSNQCLLDLRSIDSLAKSVRWDDNIFLGNFLSSITKSPENQFEEKLRKGPHKKYTVYAHGFFERSQKISPYNLPPRVLKEKKEKTSRHQSTSLVREKEPIFGHGRGRQRKLVGFIFKPLMDLINRIFIYDIGTISRPYEFDTVEEAKDYFTRSVNHHPKTLFKTLQELKDNTVNNTKNYNEVLARLKWDINTSSVGIFSDTFEARCIAQFYAKLTYQRLLCQYRELGLTLPQDYQVPIVFYLPDSYLNWQIYSTEQQANDRIKAEKIFSNEAKIKKAFDQGNFEFLLLLGDLENLSYQNLPVLFWVAHTCSMNIAKVLYEQTNTCFLVAFEEYLSDTLQKLWRVEKKCLYGWQRNICVDMALKLGLKDLVKEILKTKLVDENDSNKYGKSLFKLVEHGEFQLLTEIVTNQTIDLDQTNEEGDTLLHVVAKTNQLMLAKLLIEKGANTKIINKKNDTPLAVCIQKQIDNSDMIHLFLWSRSGDPLLFVSETRAMFKACILLNYHAVKALILFNKTFLQLRNPDGANLLHIAILSPAQNSSDREAKQQIVELLLQNGVNPAGLYQGETALELAKRKGLWDIVKEIEVCLSHRLSVAK